MCTRHLWLAFVVLSLTACGDSVEKTLSSATDNDTLASKTISGSVRGALNAVQTPLVDLNLTREEIPEKLQAVSGNPYLLPSPLQCKVLRNEIADLDALLGSDMQPKIATEDQDTDYAEEGANMLQSEAIGFVSGKVSIIPFRGVVRQITGASKYAKQYSRAYESGKLRRAYLKGISSALKCDKVKGKKLSVAAVTSDAK